MFNSVSVVCFAASYSIALVFEVSRFFFKIPVRQLVTTGLVVAGFVAHVGFLAVRSQSDVLPTSWYFGCLTLACLLAGIYAFLAATNRQTLSGLFLLPSSLALIAVGHLLSIESRSANRIWGMVHGFALLFGVLAVILGFVAGLMYLIQVYRLKHKLPPRRSFRLPSLEKLQVLNERSLYASVALLGIGLLIGVSLNLTSTDRQIPWTDPIIVASGVWLLWLVSVVIFSTTYRPSRQGRKIAYLTIGSFLFLAIVLSILYALPNEHNVIETETKIKGPRMLSARSL